MSKDRIDHYEDFAGVYDSIVGDRREASRFVKKVLHQHAPKAQALLELACGTGSMLSYLSQYYQVSGLDYSSAMLFQAQEKMPNCPLYQGDMRNFHIEQEFHAIICMYDSLNHLTKKTDWRQCIKCVAKHLSPDGVFIFDVNTPFKLERLAQEPPIIHDFDGNTYILAVNKRTTSRFDWYIRLFSPVSEDFYVCKEEVIPEVAYSHGTIKELLTPHFTVIQRCAMGGEKAKRNTERVYYVCKK